MRVERRYCRFGASTMIVCNHWIDTNRQQFSLAELDAIAVPDRWIQAVQVPVQPLSHSLARRRIRSLKSVQGLGQMLNDGGRLKVNASAVKENRDLTPAGKRHELWCLVHFLLKAHVPER